MSRKWLVTAMAVMGMGLIVMGNALAFSISVDGLLNEWGVTPNVYGSCDWIPNGGIFYNLEDTPPSQPYLGPGLGGQLYDVEAIYATYDSSNLYYAVVTGFPPVFCGTGSSYNSGDVAFDFGKDGFYEYGIASVNRPGFGQGNLYNVTQWYNGMMGAIDPLSNPSYMKTASLDSTNGDLEYKGGLYAGSHYVIEGYVPLADIDTWGQDFRMHWAMSCGNDYLNLDVPVGVVPEPASLSLLGIGLLGLVGRKKGGRKC